MRTLRIALLATIAAITFGCSKTDKGQQMLAQLNEQNLSLLVYNNDVLTTYNKHGVRDLLYLYIEEPKLLNGAIVADKKIGTAAATLMALGRVKQAHTNYITEQGKQILEEAGIPYFAKSEGPMIYQADGVSRCPVDKGTSELSTAEERLDFIINFYEKTDGPIWVVGSNPPCANE